MAADHLGRLRGAAYPGPRGAPPALLRRRRRSRRGDQPIRRAQPHGGRGLPRDPPDVHPRLHGARLHRRHDPAARHREGLRGRRGGRDRPRARDRRGGGQGAGQIVAGEEAESVVGRAARRRSRRRHREPPPAGGRLPGRWNRTTNRWIAPCGFRAHPCHSSWRHPCTAPVGARKSTADSVSAKGPQRMRREPTGASAGEDDSSRRKLRTALLLLL
mmetsp:Transcript_17916/g.41311  ORF Transcript_17916/g.41311 Transcript_17916/m.41311 type:complete len:216 (-) Transcript_17916:40-687(-)